MKLPLFPGVLTFAFCATTLTALAGTSLPPASAGENEYDGNWHFTLTPYVWLPGVSGDLNFSPPRFPDVTAHVNVDEGPFDVLKRLRFGLMATGSARIGEWSAFTDMLYV